MACRSSNGALKLIKKVWAKFEDMDLKCICDEHHRKCKATDDCKEYVVKFMEIDREQKAEEAMAQLENETNNLRKEIRKFQSQVVKSIKKFKI